MPLGKRHTSCVGLFRYHLHKPQPPPCIRSIPLIPAAHHPQGKTRDPTPSARVPRSPVLRQTRQASSLCKASRPIANSAHANQHATQGCVTTTICVCFAQSQLRALFFTTAPPPTSLSFFPPSPVAFRRMPSQVPDDQHSFVSARSGPARITVHCESSPSLFLGFAGYLKPFARFLLLFGNSGGPKHSLDPLREAGCAL